MTTPLPLNVLFIAPDAPPKNSAEAIQVRRILAECDKRLTGRLVRVAPGTSGWGRSDTTLGLALKQFDTQLLELPAHPLTNRLFISRYLTCLHVPDPVSWIAWMAGSVLRKLTQKPDIIYSRSSPMSAAILAEKLKRKLDIPWIMHLSDPWSENPYKPFNRRDAAYEEACFQQADSIMLTTNGQAEHYKTKYPTLAYKIHVSPNVMPDREELRLLPPLVAESKSDTQLRLVFAGSFYGDRSPKALLEAVTLLRATRPEIVSRLRMDFYGNAQESSLQLLRRAPDVFHYHGLISFAESQKAQCASDVILSIEAEMDNPISKCFLPSKVVDCLALGKPMLAITPEGSETAQLCSEGYGWAVAPSHTEALAARIAELAETVAELRSLPPKAPPERYSVQKVVEDLVAHMQHLVATRREDDGHSV